MKKLVPILFVLLAACGGDDDTPTATTVAGQAEACAALLDTYDVAVQAWYASGRTEAPDTESLIAAQFLDPETPTDYVEIVPGPPASVVAGPNC